MPKDGDTIEGYCGACDQRTGAKKSTWVYVYLPARPMSNPNHYWRCLGCGTERAAN